MPRIHVLTNPNPLIEEKANFFADWFHFYTFNIGKSNEFELENPLSILEKILFQLDFNLENSYPYIFIYLSHPYLKDENYLKEYKAYPQLSVYLKKFFSSSKKERQAIIKNDTQNFASLITDLKNELNEEMFKKSLSAIISFISCSHDLEKHLNEIKAHTQILVTEYLFSGKHKNDLNYIFPKILSKDISEFPFPKNITDSEAKQHHLNQMNLKDQFNGLYDLLENSAQEINYYLHVYGTKLPNGFDFKYNETTIFSDEHKMFDNAKEEYPYFFSNQGSSFIIKVSVNYYSHEIGIEEAREKIEKELDFYSNILGKNLILDKTANYLIEKNNQFRETWNSESFNGNARPDLLENLKDNPYIFLGDYNSNAKKHLLEFEYILHSAIKQKSMPGFWHYLEVLLQVNKKEDLLQEKVAMILLLEESKLNKRIAINSLFYTLDYFTLPSGTFNLSWQELKDIQKALYKGTLPDSVRQINYPLIKEILLIHDKVISQKEYSKIKEYYKSILKEAYAQRNFYIHNARSNKKLGLKLKNSLPEMIQRFRWILFDEIKLHESIEFREMIEMLYKKALNLMTSDK